MLVKGAHAGEPRDYLGRFLMWQFRMKPLKTGDSTTMCIFHGTCCILKSFSVEQMHFKWALLLTWIIFISAWISDYMPGKVNEEIINPSPSFNGCIEVWEWMSNFIPHFIVDVITFSCTNVLPDLGCTEPEEIRGITHFYAHRRCEQYVYQGEVLETSC